MTEPLRIELPEAVVEAIAQRAAAIVLERLAGLDANGRSSDAASPYLTVQEAADLLRCKRQRIDDLLSSGRLSRFKDGSRTLVSRAEVEEHLQR